MSCLLVKMELDWLHTSLNRTHIEGHICAITVARAGIPEFSYELIAA